MGVENLEHGQDADYGAAEKLDDGVYGIGRFEVIGEMMEYGLMLHGHRGDTDVSFNLSPREVLLLADLINEHREELTQGLRHEDLINSTSADMPPVHVRTAGDGPEPIPTNKSILDRPQDSQ